MADVYSEIKTGLLTFYAIVIVAAILILGKYNWGEAQRVSTPKPAVQLIMSQKYEVVEKYVFYNEGFLFCALLNEPETNEYYGVVGLEAKQHRSMKVGNTCELTLKKGVTNTWCILSSKESKAEMDEN